MGKQRRVKVKISIKKLKILRFVAIKNWSTCVIVYIRVVLSQSKRVTDRFFINLGRNEL